MQSHISSSCSYALLFHRLRRSDCLLSCFTRATDFFCYHLLPPLHSSHLKCATSRPPESRVASATCWATRGAWPCHAPLQVGREQSKCHAVMHDCRQKWSRREDHSARNSSVFSLIHVHTHHTGARILLVTCHLAAHAPHVMRRNLDYARIAANLFKADTTTTEVEGPAAAAGMGLCFTFLRTNQAVINICALTTQASQKVLLPFIRAHFKSECFLLSYSAADPQMPLPSAPQPAQGQAGQQQGEEEEREPVSSLDQVGYVLTHLLLCACLPHMQTKTASHATALVFSNVRQQECLRLLADA